MNIKPVEPSEIDSLIEIQRATWFQTYEQLGNRPLPYLQEYADQYFNREKNSEYLLCADTLIFMCWDENEPLGYMSCKVNSTTDCLENVQGLQVERIFIDSAHQNKGAGRLMLDHAKSIAIDNNLGLLWLSVYDQNQKARRFYDRLGFQYRGARDWTFNDQFYEKTDLVYSINPRDL